MGPEYNFFFELSGATFHQKNQNCWCNLLLNLGYVTVTEFLVVFLLFLTPFGSLAVRHTPASNYRLEVLSNR
jgi:hypothetical protein